MDYILELQNLTKTYDKSNFKLDNVSFSLPYGSIMGFVGANGAGKTTTIGCILNTLSKTDGTILLFGDEMADANTALREKIGVVFDSGNFSEHLSAEKLSKVMKGVYKNWNEELYQSYLQKFQIPKGKKIKELSRGMSMKLSIAAALSHEPELLILDEATGGLDPIVRDEILDAFLDFVQNERHSILLSSHITSDLEKIADYITFIHDGSIILTASKDDLIYNYAVARCKASQFETMDKNDIVAWKNRDFQIDVLLKDKKMAEQKYRDIIIDSVSIDDIMLLLIKGKRT